MHIFKTLHKKNGDYFKQIVSTLREMVDYLCPTYKQDGQARLREIRVLHTT